MNAVVKFENNLSTEDMMKMIGQGTVINPQLANLKINRQATDKEDRPLPVSTYFVYDPNSKQNVYGKPVIFRPFLNVFQYRLYDAATDAYTNKSIFFRNWNEDIIDEQGGKKCGKISGKAADALSEADQARNRLVKCSRTLFGTVTIKGVTVQGDKITVENLPCMWRTSGASFKPIGDVLEALTRENKLMFNHTFALTTQRAQNGGNVYYTPVMTRTDDVIKLTDDDIVLMKQFLEIVEIENSNVYNKYVNVQKKKLDKNEEKLVADLTKPLDADFEEVGKPFNDELPEPLQPIMAG